MDTGGLLNMAEHKAPAALFGGTGGMRSGTPDASTPDEHIKGLGAEPGAENLLATGVGDGTVALWDVRKLAKGVAPVASAGHS